MVKEEFSVEIYSKKVELIILDSPTEVEGYVKELLRLSGDDYSYIYSACGYVVCTSKEPTKYYLVLSSKDLDYNTIGHEVYHITKFILDSIVFEQDSAGEIGAYLNGYITDKVIKILIKNKIDITNGEY